MFCPVCKKEMIEKEFDEIKIDICENGCQGLWFDWMELTNLQEKNELLASALLSALHFVRANDENREALNCPKCAAPMHMHKFASAKQINIDECYVCGGIFLDSGELKEIIDNSMTEEEALVYLDKLINDIPDYKKALLSLDKQKERIAALKKYTKLLRVRYYVSGK